jgi:hypothetical protein
MSVHVRRQVILVGLMGFLPKPFDRGGLGQVRAFPPWPSTAF